MKISSAITGTWVVPSTIVEGRDEFIHIGSDGRLVHFVAADASGSRTVPMKLWLEARENHSFVVRTAPGTEGWMVRLIPTKEGVTIDRDERQFRLSRPPEDEIPDWYADKLDEALQKMADLERDAIATEQTDTGKPDPGASGLT